MKIKYTKFSNFISFFIVINIILSQIVLNTNGTSLTNIIWSSTVVVSSTSTSSSFEPSIAVDSQGNVHLIWSDLTNLQSCGDDRDIFYRCWNASFASWNQVEVVSTESSGISEAGSLAIDANNNIHVAWSDYTNYTDCGDDRDIFYKYWNSTLSSWTLTEVVSTESTDSSRYPSIIVDKKNNIHVAWDDNTPYDSSGSDYDIFCKFWNSTLSSWTLTEVISTESTYLSCTPELAADDEDNIHIVWDDMSSYASSGSDWDIFYNFRNSSLSSWTSTEVVSIESTSSSYHPSLDVDSSNNVHITWHDYTDFVADADSVILYKSRNSTTMNWNTLELISIDGTDSSYSPSLEVDSHDNVHIVWDDSTDVGIAESDTDIFYKFWNATLSIWSLTHLISTESDATSYTSSILVDQNDNIYVTWEDESIYQNCGSDVDIFCKSYSFLSLPSTIYELKPLFLPVFIGITLIIFVIAVQFRKRQN